MLPRKETIKATENLIKYSRHVAFFTDTAGKFLSEYLPQDLRGREIVATSGLITKISLLGFTLLRFNLAVAYRDEASGATKIVSVKLNKRYNNVEKQ